MKRLLLLVSALCFPLTAAEPLKLLFAGSSSMYWNDLPREVAKLVDGKIAGHAGRAVIPEAVGRSGSDIRVYLEPGFNKYEYGVKPGQTFLDKIAAEKPDIVPMMVVCRFIMGDEAPNDGSATHAEAVTKYCAAIRAAGGEPMFYEMGWGKDAREAAGRQRILHLARQNNLTLFAPCSSAWARVYAERPDLKLQHPQDGAHPGDAGHFLNLACFYAALTQQSPVGKLPRTFHVWPHGKYDADEARLATFKPDAYQATMAKWMHKHMSMGQTATLDDTTATYLETVAWATWHQVGKQLTMN
ncbi:MAG: SGNH/GDSL hydrolase family protein [Prosthecobacter sp.]|uniref:SGNH/GDSL hydrolase family protein n=1 Tax=Prosthecobacter sp. TaxID=1965333 RepID=UPI0039026296